MMDIAAASIGVALASAVPADIERIDMCRSAVVPIEQPCTLPTRFSPAAVDRLLAGRDDLWWMVGDALTFLARPGKAGWAMICCAVQTPLEPIGDSEVTGISVRIPRAREAILDVTNMMADKPGWPAFVRGIDAPPPPPEATPLRGKLTYVELPSAVLGETRGLTIYVPPDVLRGVRLPVIYIADGMAGHFAPIAEAAVDRGRAAPAILVGLEVAVGQQPGCTVQPCDRRRFDYAPIPQGETAKGDTPFARHLRFVTDEVIPYVERLYPASAKREDRLVSGYSNGGVWAFSTAAIRPDLFGKVLALSAGHEASISYAGRLTDADIYAGAGLFEPYYLSGTRERARLAQQAGSSVEMRTLVSGHSIAMWNVMFAEGLVWLLPPGK